MAERSILVAVDGKHLSDQPTGVGRALAGVLSGLDELQPDGLELRVVEPEGKARTLPWTMLGLPRRARGADVLHCPFYYRPLSCGRATSVVVHDLLVITHPHWFPWRGRRPFADLIRFSIHRADAIITPSQCILDAIEDRFGSLRGRGVAVPHGVDGERFFPRDAATCAAVRRRHRLQRPFVLHVGSLNPRRGLDTAMAALEKMEPELELVVAGKHEHRWGAVPDALAARVRCLGYVSDDDLPALMSAAEAILALSRGEGFDLPLLEALACGAPVVASDIPPHREHFAQLATLVPVGDSEAVAAAVAQMLSQSLSSERTRQAAEVQQRFRWSDAAAAHVAVWKQIGARE